MAAREEIIEGVAEAFDELRSEFLPPGATLEFLKIGTGAEQPDGTLSADYINIAAVENGWFPEFDKHRQQTSIQIATLEDGFGAIFTTGGASHARMAGIVYKLIDGDDGRIPPMGDKLFWTVFCKTDSEQGFR